jgi:hypothetical protein
MIPITPLSVRQISVCSQRRPLQCTQARISYPHHHSYHRRKEQMDAPIPPDLVVNKTLKSDDLARRKKLSFTRGEDTGVLAVHAIPLTATAFLFRRHRKTISWRRGGSRVAVGRILEERERVARCPVVREARTESCVHRSCRFRGRNERSCESSAGFPRAT